MSRRGAWTQRIRCGTAPNLLDEGHFVLWDLHVDGQRFRTAASHVIRGGNLSLLARYIDPDIPAEDPAAVIAELEYGQGLFFLTQVFGPEAVIAEDAYATETWALLLENALSYFADRRAGKLLPVRVETQPWSVRAGETVEVRVIPDSECECQVAATVTFTEGADTGAGQFARSAGADPGVYVGHIALEQSGTATVRATVTAADGCIGVGHSFFKVIKEFTPIRFTTHTHYDNRFAPDSLGQLYGLARRLGVDILCLCGDEEVAEEAAAMDNPAVRMFPGQEIHVNRAYTPEEGCPPENPDQRRHATTVGVPEYFAYAHDFFDPADLAYAHKAGGICIVAHPYFDPWWTAPQAGQNFEAVEFDRVDVRVWDKMLMAGELVTGVCGIDNLGHTWFAQRGPNIGWFDAPLSPQELVRTIVNGRVTKMNTFPVPTAAVGAELRFTVNHQISGGTVYVVDQAIVRVVYHCHLPVQTFWIVRGGDRGSTAAHDRCFEPDVEYLDHTVIDLVDKDTYYRVELSYDKTYHPLCISSLSNPVFVKKVPGPPHGYLRFLNEALVAWDEQRGRYVAQLTEVKAVSFNEGIWRVEIEEPTAAARCFFAAENTGEARVDAEVVDTEAGEEGERMLRLGGGPHIIEIEVGE